MNTIKFHIIVSATSMLAFIALPSCKNHRDSSKKDAQSFLDSAVFENVDSIANLEEVDFDWFDEQSQRYNPSAKRINDIIHTQLDVSFDIPNKQLMGKARIDIKPYFAPTDSLLLDAKAFTVQRVAMIGKGDVLTDLPYTYDKLQLHISLGRKFTRNDNYRIYIEYVANPDSVKTPGSEAITDAKGLYFIDPKDEDPTKPTQIWTQGETESSSCWFPTIDKPNEKMTQEITITVPEKYLTLSNGLKTLSKKNADGTRSDTWKMDQPHAPYLAMMAIGEFAVVKDTWRKIPVDYFVEKEFEPYAKNIFGKTPEMIEFFSNRLGVDYPWPKYSQVVVRDYVSGAMENTSATLFGEFVQQTPSEMLDGNFEDVISHELFHHWFGDLVTCESWANLTLNESFATYGEYLWREFKYGRDEADEHLQEDFNTYIGESLRKKVNLVRFNYETREDMFDRHTYQKGGLILHMLRKYLGDDAFFEGLKTYLTENKYQAAEFHQLRMAFEKVSGEDLNWFFNQWYLDKGHPNLVASIMWDEEKKESIITVEQAHDLELSSHYKLPLDVDIYEKGATRRIRIVIDSLNQTFRISAAAKPDLIVLDAEHQLLGKLFQNLTTEEAQLLFYKGKTYLDRFIALDVMLDNTSEPGMIEVLKSALRDPFWNIRLYALNQLDAVIAQNFSDFKPLLVQLAQNDSKSSVRSAALDKLANNTKSSGEDFPLFTLSLRDSSALVQGTALKGMYAASQEETIIALASIEKKAKGSMLSSIAAIYSNAAVSGKFEFFKDAYTKITNPNEKYFFIQQMGMYALSQDETVKRAALPEFERIARNGEAWWLRLAGIQVISEYLGNYTDKLEKLKSVTEATGIQSDEVEKEKLEIEQYISSLDEMLGTIISLEKDSNLIRILSAEQ